jgi:hypothetical protein
MAVVGCTVKAEVPMCVDPADMAFRRGGMEYNGVAFFRLE